MLVVNEDLLKIKDEIKMYLKLLNNPNQLPNQNNLTCIAKLILFNKKFFSYYENENYHYKNCMIYNLLMIMNSLNKNSLLYFHQLYRSYIENYIRSMINLKNDDETGVNNLFRQFEQKFDLSNEMVGINNFIKGEYSKSCDFVHSNMRADLSVCLFYQEILNSDEMNARRLKSLILKVQTLLLKNTTLILIYFPQIVDSIFYRKRNELKFLVGNDLFIKYKEALCKWEET